MPKTRMSSESLKTRPAVATIVVSLPPDRRLPGTLVLADEHGEIRFGPAPVLGKADNAAAARRGNPRRDPVRPFGDTPCGAYRCAPARPARLTAELERKYGPHGWITLNPVAGQALEAKRNGRFGLLIHGGAPGAGGALRPTFGCLRLTNGDMRGLMEIVGQIPASLLRCQVREKS